MKVKQTPSGAAKPRRKEKKMKLVKTDKAWSFSDYKSVDGRFLFKNIHSCIESDGRSYSLPPSRCGFELYDNGELIGFFKTLKSAKEVAQSR